MNQHIFPLLSTYVIANIKASGRLHQIFMAFLDNMNFISRTNSSDTSKIQI